MTTTGVHSVHGGNTHLALSDYMEAVRIMNNAQLHLLNESFSDRNYAAISLLHQSKMAAKAVVVDPLIKW